MDKWFDEITDDELWLYADDLELASNDELFDHSIDIAHGADENEEYQAKHLLKVDFFCFSFFFTFFCCQTSDEQNLSQKLSQLSTSHSKPSTIPINVIGNEKDNKEDITKTIPDYLSQGNKSFEQFISNQQISANSNLLIEELRTLAVLINEISTLNLQKSLWMTYLKSGTAQLVSKYQKDLVTKPQFWPPQMIQSMSIDRKNEDATSYLNYVTNQLSQYDDKIKNYEIELNQMKGKYLTSNYIKILEAYVQQGLTSIRRNIELQMALVQYDYSAHVLELIFLRNHPTDEQVSLLLWY